MPAVLTFVWNRHRKFKKIQNDVTPSRGVIIYVLVSTKKNIGIRQLYWKGVHRNELSSTKILGFWSKWWVLWPHPWHSLLKYAHVIHKHASWKYGQCWRRKFSFLLDKKTIFHTRKMEIFFLSNKKENFLCQLCPCFQDACLCIISCWWLHILLVKHIWWLHILRYHVGIVHVD